MKSLLPDMFKEMDEEEEKEYWKSLVVEKAPVVDHYIQFADGSEKTFKGVRTDTAPQSEPQSLPQFRRFELENGTVVYVNTSRVNFFEVHTK